MPHDLKELGGRKPVVMVSNANVSIINIDVLIKHSRYSKLVTDGLSKLLMVSDSSIIVQFMNLIVQVATYNFIVLIECIVSN